MEVSCGVIITDGVNLLACHPTGKKKTAGNYDIPKGRMEPNERPVETAVRELEEETGLKLTEEDLVDLGEFNYKKDKKLHLFLYTVDAMPDISSLFCASKFSMYGRLVPEMDGYKIVSDSSWFYPKLGSIINTLV